MKQLTTNEVQQVSGGWEMGAWSGVGTTLGSYINPSSG